MKRLSSALLITLAALAVSACGLRGDLDRPPPMWGDAQQSESDRDDARDGEREGQAKQARQLTKS